jgi:photosynthetic reaction center cytochrome c subunit
MTRGSIHTIAAAVGATIVSLAGVAWARGQNGPAERPPMAETTFTNVQVLKGIPVNEFMEAMGIFTASLGVGCDYCHVAEAGGSWARYADDNAKKRTARGMVLMMSAINRDSFGGRQVVTCYTCHRGGNRPKVTPSLAALYGASSPEEANDVIAPVPGATSADVVLDKYIRALGGAERLAGFTSVAAKGTYKGYDDTEKYPLEVFAKAPGQRTTIVHARDGDRTTTYDGRTAWTAAPSTERPVPVLALAGGDLDGVKLDAELAFPARMKMTLRNWRVGFRTTVEDREVEVVQGTSAGGTLATLYFDVQSGLLVRLVRYADSRVGRIPMQTDYADYRDVGGVKLPFRISATWLDGRSTIELSDVKINVPIAPSTFAKPVAPTSPGR